MIRKLLAAYTLLDCTACGFRSYVLVDERGPWDGRCPRCRNDAFRYGGSRAARTPRELAIVQFEGTIANEEPPEPHAGTRRDDGGAPGA